MPRIETDETKANKLRQWLLHLWQPEALHDYIKNADYETLKEYRDEFYPTKDSVIQDRRSKDKDGGLDRQANNAV